MTKRIFLPIICLMAIPFSFFVSALSYELWPKVWGLVYPVFLATTIAIFGCYLKKKVSSRAKQTVWTIAFVLCHLVGSIILSMYHGGEYPFAWGFYLLIVSFVTLSVTGIFLFSYTPASVEDTGSKRKITFSILCAVVIATAVFLLIDIGNVQKVKEFIPYFVVLFVSLILGGFLLTSFFDRKKGSNKIGDIYAVLSLLLILIAYICFFTVCIVWENNYRLIGNIGSYNVVGMLILAVLVFADRKNASKCFLFSSVAILNLVVLIMLIFIPCSADSALYDVLRVVKNNSDVLLVNIAISVSYMIWHLIRILLTKQRTVS